MTLGNQYLYMPFFLLLVLFMPPATPAYGQGEDLPLLGEVITTIRLYEDGLAEWVLETRFQLQTIADREAFENYTSNFTSQKTVYLEDFEAKMKKVVVKAETITGRSMHIEDFEASALQLSMLDKEYGVIRYTFHWIDFASLDDGEMRIGDIFEGGYYLSNNEVLVISLPKPMRTVSVEPSPQRREGQSLVWLGPRNFGPGEPRIILIKRTALGLPLPLLAALTVTILLSLMAAWIWIKRIKRHNRDRRSPGENPAIKSPGGEDLTTEGPGSGEERILELITLKGRIPQSSIVRATGLSKSKVSSVLTQLEEKDLVERSRLGREKMVYLQTRRKAEPDEPEPLKQVSLQPRQPSPREKPGIAEHAHKGMDAPSDIPDGCPVLVTGPKREVKRFAYQRVEGVLRAGAKAAVVQQDAGSTATDGDDEFDTSLLLATAKHGQHLNIVTSRPGLEELAAAISRVMLQRPRMIVIDATQPLTQTPGSERALEVLETSLHKASDMGTSCLWLLDTASNETLDLPRLDTLFNTVFEIKTDKHGKELTCCRTKIPLESMNAG